MAYRIDSLDDALEASEQYRELGLPIPTDVLAYLQEQGNIVIDADGQPIENVEDIYE